MDRKRPAPDSPTAQEDDSLMKILQVLNETSSARRALLEQAQSVQDCLSMAETLHQMLATVHGNLNEQLMIGIQEQAQLQQVRHALQGATANLR